MEGKCPYENLRMPGMNRNLCILSMLEDTLLLGAAHLMYHCTEASLYEIKLITSHYDTAQ